LLLSKLANRDYHNEVLDNGLELAFITCPEATKSAISISIGIGHFNDPADCPGLSHLLEHMLFTGSERFADGNYLHDLVHKEGGFLNAWTSAQTCNFHFDCPEHLLQEGLDVLIDMVFHPRFELKGIEQEIQAIEAEFHLRINDDVRRLYDVHKQTANAEHPFTKFSVGNKGVFSQFTLADMQQKLRDHHCTFFTPNNIKIVIHAQQSESNTSLIAGLKQSVLDIKTSSPLKKPPLPALYLPKQKNCLIEVKPFKSAQTLIFTFCLPSISDHYRSKPILLLTHLLEDANKDGLQWYLKNEAYIVDLSASGGLEDGRHQDININLRLTEKGLNNVAHIIKTVLAWFDYLRQEGFQQWRFEEKAQQLWLQAQHASLPSPVDECILIANRLHDFSFEEALNIDSTMDRYDPVFFTTFLSYFTADHLRVFYIHDDAQTDHVTQQYKAPFSVKPLPSYLREAKERNDQCVSSVSKTFELPSRNHYMSSNFALVDKELEHEELHEFLHEQIVVKFSQNTSFETPKGDCYFSLESPSMVGSARNAAIKRLWIECISEQLSEEYSSAEMAGISFRVYGHQGGFSLHTSGFSHTQLMLCEEIIAGLSTLAIKPAVFLTMKEKLATTLKNNLLNKPVNQLFAALNIALQQNNFSQKEILDELDNIYLPELQSHVDSYFKTLHLEGLIVGNWRMSEVRNCVQNIAGKLPECNQTYKTQRSIVNIFGQQHSIVVSPYRSSQKQNTEPDSSTKNSGKENNIRENATVFYYQAENSSLLNRCIFVALEKLLSPFLFDELRNKKNLGYLVGCGYMPMNKRPGIAIYVQSPTHDCDAMARAMDDALFTFQHDLKELVSIFDNFKSSLARQFEIEDTNTSQYSQRLWVDFDSSVNSEAFKQAISSTLAELSFDEFYEQFEQIFIQRNTGFMHLSTQAVSNHRLN
jgi:secreted Zn-dependent insulinase-like peptidase